MSRHKQTRPDTSQPSRVDSWKAPSETDIPAVDLPEPTDLITAQEAADLVGVSRKTVDRRVTAKGDRQLQSWLGVRDGKEVRLVSRVGVLQVWPQKGPSPAMARPVATRPDTAQVTARGSDINPEAVRTPSVQATLVGGSDVIAELRAAAGRVPDLEARVIAEKSRADGAEAREAEVRIQVLEERRERRVATAAVLRQLQAASNPELAAAQGPVMIAAPMPEEVRGSRRFAYAMAAASCLAVAVLGWRLVDADADLTRAAERIDSVVGEKALVAQEAAQLAGELNATRETLRDERERTAALERLSVEAQREAKEAREAAAIAFGVRTMLRTAGGR